MGESVGQVAEGGLMKMFIVGGAAVHWKKNVKIMHESRAGGRFAAQMSQDAGHDDLPDIVPVKKGFQIRLEKGVVAGFDHDMGPILGEFGGDPAQWTVGPNEVIPPGGHDAGVLGSIDVTGENDRPIFFDKCGTERTDTEEDLLRARDKSMGLGIQKIPLHIQNHKGCLSRIEEGVCYLSLFTELFQPFVGQSIDGPVGKIRFFHSIQKYTRKEV